MATRVKLMKFLQEIRGYAEITNRRPTPRPAVLYLMALRTHTTDAAPKRRITISIDIKNPVDIPHPVKITHLEAGESALPIVIG